MGTPEFFPELPRLLAVLYVGLRMTVKSEQTVPEVCVLLLRPQYTSTRVTASPISKQLVLHIVSYRAFNEVQFQRAGNSRVEEYGKVRYCNTYKTSSMLRKRGSRPGNKVLNFKDT